MEHNAVFFNTLLIIGAGKHSEQMAEGEQRGFRREIVVHKPEVMFRIVGIVAVVLEIVPVNPLDPGIGGAEGQQQGQDFRLPPLVDGAG